MYDEATGEPALWRGEKLPRHKGCPAPCVKGACPKGSPDAGIALSDHNARAWRHYRECQAIGRFPDDPIVAFNALTIKDAEGEALRSIKRGRRD